MEEGTTHHAAPASDRLARAVIESLLPAVGTLLIVTALVVLVVGRLEAEELALNTRLIGWRPLGELSGLADVSTAIGRSLVLLLAGLAIAIPLGVGAALAHYLMRSGWSRAALWTVGTVGASLPTFFWAILAQLIVIAGHEAAGGFALPAFGFGIDDRLVLPALVLAARPASYAYRLSVSAIDQVGRGDYVRTARSKGLREGLVLLRHVVPNAAPGIAAALVLSARGALSSLAVVEFFFGWGGAAVSFIQAIIDRDALVAALLVSSLVALSTVLTIASASLAARARAEAIA